MSPQHGVNPPMAHRREAATAVPHGHDQSRQDRAQAAVSRGEAVPLAQVLTTIAKTTPGQVLSVSLDRKEPDEWTYYVTVLTPTGEYCDIAVDAKRNKLLQTTWR
jgi:uncharacterized membrane protein YkoI